LLLLQYFPRNSVHRGKKRGKERVTSYSLSFLATVGGGDKKRKKEKEKKGPLLCQRAEAAEKGKKERGVPFLIPNSYSYQDEGKVP